jgi:hypothetical protein
MCLQSRSMRATPTRWVPCRLHVPAEVAPQRSRFLPAHLPLPYLRSCCDVVLQHLCAWLRPQPPSPLPCLQLCDQVSDAILDACLAQDPESKVACETATKTNMVRGALHAPYCSGEVQQPWLAPPLGGPARPPAHRRGARRAACAGDGVWRDHHPRQGGLRGHCAADVPQHWLHLGRRGPGRRQVQGAGAPGGAEPRHWAGRARHGHQDPGGDWRGRPGAAAAPLARASPSCRCLPGAAARSLCLPGASCLTTPCPTHSPA